MTTPKRHLKSGFVLFQNHRSYLILFTLSNVGEIFWVEPKRTVRKFRKRKTKLLCCAHLLHKAGEVSRRSRATTAKKCTKKRDARAKMFFCCSPSPLQKLPIVVIQKFCYHGNVTSHFSSLLAKQLHLMFKTEPTRFLLAHYYQ